MMVNDSGRSPGGSGYSAELGPEEVSAVPVSIPNAVHFVSVMLSKREGNLLTQTMTQSWSAGPRDAAIVRAFDYAKEQKPGFGIDQWLVADIPLPFVPIDDGARTAPRIAADIVRQFDPGRSGLIYNLERLADHLDACSASVDRSPKGEKPQALNAKHESAVPDRADAPNPQE